METLVIENGVWVTRRRELWEVMQGNQPPQEKQDKPVQKKQPVIGIFTRPIVETPVISLILPARIRGKDKNDVLFFGLHSMHIKELTAEGRLEDVATMHSAHTIISARVIGAFGKISFSEMDFIKREPSREGSPKLYDPGSALEGVSVEHRPRTLPLQLAVISDTSGSLVFIYAQDLTAGGVDFHSVRISLPVRPTRLEQPGNFLAVDPKSRAMAAAAHENCFIIYALQPMKKIQEDVWSYTHSGSQAFQPIKEERVILFEGIIRQIEFLHPPTADEDRVILILLITRQNGDCLTTYEWSDSKGLREMETKQLPAISADSDNPFCLLIPLTLSCAVLLVHKWSVSIWTGMSRGRLECTYQAEIYTHRTGSEPHHLWAAWTRPVRTEHWAQLHDAIYLVNDQGVVRFLELETESSGQVLPNAAMPAGELNCNVDTAFASLNMGVAMDDFLITAGSMSNGGLYMVKPKKDAMLIQRIPNWSPINDLFLSPVLPMPTKYSKENILNPEEKLTGSTFERDRILTATGMGEYGAITEFREAIPARITMRMPGGSMTDRLWIISNEDATKAFILQSSLQGSRLYSISDDISNPGTIQVEQTYPEYKRHESGIDIRSPTLAIGVLGDFCIQITSTGIHKAGFQYDLLKSVSNREWYKAWPMCEEGEKWTFELAAVKGSDPQLTLAIILELGVGTDRIAHSLLLYEIREDNWQASDVIRHSRQLLINVSNRPDSTVPKGNIELSSTAVSLYMFEINDVTYIAIGTRAASVQIFGWQNEKLLLCCESVLGDGPDAAFDVCQSMALLQPEKGGVEYSKLLPSTLLCGLRNGAIVILQLDFHTPEALSIARLGRVDIGLTPVNLVDDQKHPSIVLASCNAEFCRLTYDHYGYGGISIKSIHLLETQESATQVPIISACCWVVNKTLSCTQPLRSIVCATNDELLIADLEKFAKPTLRMIPVGGSKPEAGNLLGNIPGRISDPRAFGEFSLGLAGTPRKIIYSSFLNLLIVAFTKHSEKSRRSYSSLKFLDPHTGQQRCLDTHLNTFVRSSSGKGLPDFGRADERIMDMTEWWCTKENTRFHFLVIGTAQLATGYTGPTTQIMGPTGRLLILSIKWEEHDGQKRVVCSAKNASITEYPVNSVVPFGQNALLLTAGDEIELRRLVTSTKRFKTPIRHPLDHPVIQILVKNEYAYVSTSDGSITIIEYVSGQLSQFGVFNELDHILRIRHLDIPNTPFFLSCTAQKGLGLLEEFNDGTMPNLRDIVKVELPHSVTRLQVGHVRSPWTIRPLLPGVIGLDESGKNGLDILGSTTTGTIYQIILLNEAAWHLLRYIQNLVQTYLYEPDAFTLQTRVADIIEPVPQAEDNVYHISSELMNEALNAGPDGLIKMMGHTVSSWDQADDTSINRVDLDARKARVAQLVAALLGKEVKDPVEFTVDYIRKLLGPIW